jgi:Kef-type K+ transport system membrane component KefB
VEAEAFVSAFHVVLQLLVVLAVTSGCGWLLRQTGQPRVVGEIAGGLLLGPLVLGQVAPRSFAALFPHGSLGLLEGVSRVGLILFLSVIGAELDIAAIRRNTRGVVATMAGSVLVPFAMGCAIAPLLWLRFPAHGGFTGFALFTGIAMSITALPVLASILRDRASIGRPVSHEIAAVALLSAAGNDAVAWCSLAVILALLQTAGAWGGVALRICLLLAFVGAMLLLGRPLLPRLLDGMPRWLAAILLIVLAFGTSAATEWMGVHAFFGAFLAGLCVPRNHAIHALYEWWQPVIRITLPVFFALTGLRMQPGLFRRDGLVWLSLIVVVAVTGKVGGSTVAARWGGMTWAQAGRIGVLLNTRGLVELIVLNVGYKEGILNANLFTLMVLMALITTAMTAPVLDLLPNPDHQS